MRLEDVEKLLAIVDGSHFTEINLQVGDVQLFARKGPATDGSTTGGSTTNGGPAPAASITGGAPAAAAPSASTAAAPAPSATGAATTGGHGTSEEHEGELVRAPMLGVFFRAPSPGAEPFAQEGQEVSPHDTIGSIEVMKLFSSIPAGTRGTLVRFLVENGTLVEYNQPLAVVRPHVS